MISRLNNDYFRFSQGNHAAFSKDEDRLHRFTRFLYSHLYLSYLISDSVKKLYSHTDTSAAAASFDESQKQGEIDYSMAALRRIQELSKAHNFKFKVGIYRDVVYEADPQGWLKYEETIERNLDRNRINWFVVKSHMDNLKASEVRASWNDPHPGAKAISFIVEDMLQAIQ